VGAAFEDGEDEVISPLVGWALVQKRPAPRPWSAWYREKRVELCDDDPDFTGYVFLPDAAADEFEIESDIFEEERRRLRRR
jgi:hypothetical protein